MTEALLKVLVSSVEEVQRSEGQRGVGTEGKVSYGSMSGAKNSGERLSLWVSLPSVTHLECGN